MPDSCRSGQAQLSSFQGGQLGGVPDPPELPVGSGCVYLLWDLSEMAALPGLLPFPVPRPHSLTSLSWDHFLNKPLVPKFLSYVLLLGTLTSVSGDHNSQGRTSLVAQWLRICLPMQGTWVRALVREDPTCRGAAKPVNHNY